MALLKDNKIYNIKVFGSPADFSSEEQCLEMFMTEYKKVTGITEEKYITINSYDGYKYFILPYINEPLNNLYLALGFPSTIIQTTAGEEIGSFKLLAIEENSDGKKITPLYSGNSTNELKDGLNTIIDSSSLQWRKYEEGENRKIGVWFQIDARFLETHGFYTINSVSFGNLADEISYTNSTKVNFSPNFFVCDLIDQITEEHCDSLIRMPNGSLQTIYGLYLSTDNKTFQEGVFRPQFYARKDNSIEFQRLQFGRWKSNNIYITDISKYEKLTQLSDLDKDKSNGWNKNIFKTYVGNVTLGKIFNSQYERSYSDFKSYVPAIINGDFKIDLPSWSTGTDEEITNVIQDYYKGEISLEDIKTVWKVGESRKVLLSAMPATYVEESHREQEVELVILGFSDDCIKNYSYNSGNEIHNEEGLMTIQQKDCLMDADCAAGTKYGKDNTENGILTIKSETLTGYLIPITWKGLTNFTGYNVWNGPNNTTYYTKGEDNYKLVGDTWEPMTWNNAPSGFAPYGGVWFSEYGYTYYSYGNTHCILRGENTWEPVNFTFCFADLERRYTSYSQNMSIISAAGFYGKNVYRGGVGVSFVLRENYGTGPHICEYMFIPDSETKAQWYCSDYTGQGAMAGDLFLWKDHKGNPYLAHRQRRNNSTRHWDNVSWHYVDNPSGYVSQWMESDIWTTKNATYMKNCRLDLKNLTLEEITWKDKSTETKINITPSYVWTDGEKTYLSTGQKHYVFEENIEYEKISSHREKWCNEIYYNALPEYLRTLIRETDILFKSGNETTLEKAKIFLTGPNYSNQGNSNNYDHLYYKDKKNWVKLPRYDEDILTAYWVNSESNKNDNRTMIMLDNTNKIIKAHDDPTQKYGIAPAMCL